jgi:hypothetical protein
MSVVAFPQLEHDEGCWTRDYWLRHCEGYAVESSKGRIGYVEEILRAEESGDPAELVVRDGSGERSTVVIPIERIREIRPSCERIVVDEVTVPGR